MRPAVLILLAIALTGCAAKQQPSLDDEMQRIEAAGKPFTGAELQAKLAAAKAPASEKAAQEAVKVFFNKTLRDPESARYSFQPMVRGQAHSRDDQRPLVGWFMCGTINSKNGFGGYAGQAPWIVYFKPDDPAHVQWGLLGDDGDVWTVTANGRCAEAYGKT
jgi:hypothetical protein